MEAKEIACVTFLPEAGLSKKYHLLQAAPDKVFHLLPGLGPSEKFTIFIPNSRIDISQRLLMPLILARLCWLILKSFNSIIVKILH